MNLEGVEEVLTQYVGMRERRSENQNRTSDLISQTNVTTTH
jgi:hypothetical protein